VEKYPCYVFSLLLLSDNCILNVYCDFHQIFAIQAFLISSTLVYLHFLSTYCSISFQDKPCPSRDSGDSKQKGISEHVPSCLGRELSDMFNADPFQTILLHRLGWKCSLPFFLACGFLILFFEESPSMLNLFPS